MTGAAISHTVEEEPAELPVTLDVRPGPTLPLEPDPVIEAYKTRSAGV